MVSATARSDLSDNIDVFGTWVQQDHTRYVWWCEYWGSVDTLLYAYHGHNRQLSSHSYKRWVLSLPSAAAFLAYLMIHHLVLSLLLILFPLSLSLSLVLAFVYVLYDFKMGTLFYFVLWLGICFFLFFVYIYYVASRTNTHTRTRTRVPQLTANTHTCALLSLHSRNFIRSTIHSLPPHTLNRREAALLQCCHLSRSVLLLFLLLLSVLVMWVGVDAGTGTGTSCGETKRNCELFLCKFL